MNVTESSARKDLILINQPLQILAILVIMVSTIVLNLLLIHNISSNAIKNNSVSFVLIKNLCIVDLVGALLILPVPLLATINGVWDYAEYVCVLNSIINVALWIQHIVVFALIKVDRALASSLPFGSYPLISVDRVTLIVGFLWLGAFVFSTMATVKFKCVFEPTVILCIPHLPTGFFFSVLCIFSLSLVVMTFGYGCGFMHSRRAQNKINSYNNMNIVDFSTKRRSYILSFCGTVFHFLLYLPTFLVVGLKGWILPPFAILICDWLVYCEFLMHPLVLILTSKKLRRELKQLLFKSGNGTIFCLPRIGAVGQKKSIGVNQVSPASDSTMDSEDLRLKTGSNLRHQGRSISRETPRQDSEVLANRHDITTATSSLNHHVTNSPCSPTTLTTACSHNEKSYVVSNNVVSHQKSSKSCYYEIHSNDNGNNVGVIKLTEEDSSNEDYDSVLFFRIVDKNTSPSSQTRNRDDEIESDTCVTIEGNNIKQ